MLNRMITLIAISVLLLCRISAFGAAKIEFEKEEIVCRPVITGKTIKNINFKFKNTGDADLEIKDIQVDCGCTVAQAIEKTVAPGKSSSITVSFDTTDIVGQSIKTITVFTNDPDKQSVVLHLKADVRDAYRVMPKFIFFGAIKPNTMLTRTIEILPVDPAKFVITKVECQSGGIVSVSSYKKVKDKKGTRWVVTLQIKAGPNAAKIYESVLIYGKSDSDLSMNIAVYGSIEE